MFGRKKKETLDNGLPAAGQVNVAPAAQELSFTPATPEANVTPASSAPNVAPQTGTPQAFDLGSYNELRNDALKAAFGLGGSNRLENVISEAMHVAEAYQQSALQQMGAAAPAGDPLDRIKKLNDLRQAGALTDAEFEAQKKKILGEA